MIDLLRLELGAARKMLARDRPKYLSTITPRYLAEHLTSRFDHYSIRIIKMSNKRPPSPVSWKDMEFINVNLSEEHVRRFKTWSQEQRDSIPDRLGSALLDYYRMSLVWDDNNQCFIATLTGKPEQVHNAGKALSSRSDDWYEAITLTLYKHEVLFNNKSWQGTATKNNWG